MTAASDEHVGGAHTAVPHRMLMEGAQGLGQLGAEPCHLGPGERMASGQHVERLALDPLADDPVAAVLVQDVEDVDEPRVGDAGQRTDFAQPEIVGRRAFTFRRHPGHLHRSVELLVPAAVRLARGMRRQEAVKAIPANSIGLHLLHSTGCCRQLAGFAAGAAT